LDLGITRIDGADKHMLKYKFGRASFVTIEDHAKWKYLVSADGCVAQTRLAKVMLSNSVVVKEDSDWIEFYYRWARGEVMMVRLRGAFGGFGIPSRVARLEI
jgi:hypothetical protein